MEKKICGICKEEKLVEDFHKNPTRKDGLQEMCKSCRKTYHRQHYLKNKEKYINKALNSKEYLKNLVNRYKSIKGCEICREKRYWVLEFHHIDRNNKKDNINKFVNNSNLKLLKEEIKKCKVLCGNCHNDLHYKQGWC